nr:UDP-N-acetylglucosamine 2-epimerase (non-hydrolyzing) [Curtobacterium pusillum]
MSAPPPDAPRPTGASGPATGGGSVTGPGRIAVVAGTRPEVIKLAPVVRRLGDDAEVVLTGQHHDPELLGQHLGSALPDTPVSMLAPLLEGSHRVGLWADQLTHRFRRVRPSAVVVQGDTDSVVAGAMAARAVGVPIVHVEAGLRSHDLSMPEEVNRRYLALVADVHCAPTFENERNLLAEGVGGDRILVTGNTIVEAVRESRRADVTDVDRWLPPGIVRGEYVLATIHRPENTDHETALRRALTGLAELDVPVVLAAHPRTRAAIERSGCSRLAARLVVRTPPDHGLFLTLAEHARLVVSDSGGVQEESTVLGFPLVTVRRNTERPESLAAGFNRLVTPLDDLGAVANAMLRDPNLRERLRRQPSPYGDGHASDRIAQICRDGVLPAWTAA